MGWHLQPQHQDMAAETRASLLKGVSQPWMCPQHPPGLCNVSLGFPMGPPQSARHRLARGIQPWDGDRDGDSVAPQQPLPSGTEQ